MGFEDVSRRGFLKGLTSAAGAAWLTAHWPAVLAAAQDATRLRASGSFEFLKPADAADLAAIAAQIFPSDELPGATEAGVVYFMDSALRTFMSDAAGGVQKGLLALNKKAGAGFATLPPEEQARLLNAEEKSDFFGTIRFMTVAGMFALPSYGGNKDFSGWTMLGFEHRMAWQPPFGHYDAEMQEPGAKS